MRDDLEILQSALSSKDLKKEDLEKLSDYNNRNINLYSVRLPENFKGLPRKWLFGILPDKKQIKDKKIIYKEADEIINKLREKNREIPIVFISDNIHINFGDELMFKNQPVFFLNKFELPEKVNISRQNLDTPVLLAARRKYKNSEATILLSPYSPNVPVSGWQFFGRKKELTEILKNKSNYFIIGARRMGKTSLLQEVSRHLKENGETVYWIECQYKEKVRDIINDILKQLSARDYYRALMKDKNIEINFITTILRHLKGDKKSIVLIFDELGNVINNISDESWKFIGALREVSHNSNIRIIVSAFQEVLAKQKKNSEGPFVNFGETIQISPFSKSEIEELLVEPLNFWGKIKNKSIFEGKIKKYFGGHPLVLQFVGKRLIELIIKDEEKPVDDLVDKLFEEELKYFSSAAEDLFIKIDSYLERYIFLALCLEFESQKKEITSCNITQDLLKTILEKVGIESDYDKRIFLLDRLTLRGLLSQDPSNRNIYKIESPIIYFYMKRYYLPIEETAENYLKEIRNKKTDLV